MRAVKGIGTRDTRPGDNGGEPRVETEAADLFGDLGPGGAGDTAGTMRTTTEEFDRLRFPPGYRRIFVAAITAFAERGFHLTSTRDIAARAGMSPAALYVHFSSKEEVLYRIATSALDLTASVVSAAIEGSGAPTERLRAVVRAITSWHAHHAPAARIVLYHLDALTPEHRAEVTGRQREIDRTVRRIITDGVAAGEFDTDDAGLATLTVMALCVDVARWYRPDYRHSPEDLGAQYAEAALRIVGAVRS